MRVGSAPAPRRESGHRGGPAGPSANLARQSNSLAQEDKPAAAARCTVVCAPCGLERL